MSLQEIAQSARIMPNIMKRWSLVRISPPFLCGHVQKKKRDENVGLSSKYYINHMLYDLV